jgi:hypothetical protein
MVFLLASISYFVVDARSTGLIFFVSSLIVLLVHMGFKPRLGHIVMAGLGLALVGYPAYYAYVDYTLTYNPWGHNGQQLRLLHNPYNPFELLQVGRSEWLVLPTAIGERPIFGWGSWAIDEGGRFTYMRRLLLGEKYFTMRASLYEGQYIPVHSLVGSAWLWSGLLGFIAMVWLLVTILRLALRVLVSKSELLPAVVFLTFLMIWHYFFSPPQVVRLNFPVVLAALIVLGTSAPALRGGRGATRGATREDDLF